MISAWIHQLIHSCDSAVQYVSLVGNGQRSLHSSPETTRTCFIKEYQSCNTAYNWLLLLFWLNMHVCLCAWVAIKTSLFDVLFHQLRYWLWAFQSDREKCYQHKSIQIPSPAGLPRKNTRRRNQFSRISRAEKTEKWWCLKEESFDCENKVILHI